MFSFFLGIEASRRLGVEPILTAKQMCDSNTGYLGIMAYAAQFSKLKPADEIWLVYITQTVKFAYKCICNVDHEGHFC